MKYNPILTELYKIRDDHAKKFNYDIHAICRDLMEQQKASGGGPVAYALKRLNEAHPAPLKSKPKVKPALRAKLPANAPKRKRSA